MSIYLSVFKIPKGAGVQDQYFQGNLDFFLYNSFWDYVLALSICVVYFKENYQYFDLIDYQYSFLVQFSKPESQSKKRR